MRRCFGKAAIIGALLAAAALLSGCSALRLSYANGPQLAWWWLDGYVDFSDEATPRAKDAIDRWFDWHRTTQLPETAALLVAAAADLQQPMTAEQACRWQRRVVDHLEPAIERAVELGAELVPMLGEPQFRHLEQRYAKNRAELRRDHLQPDRDERLKAAVKRSVERVETIYGSVDDNVKRVVAQGVANSPFSPEQWLAERERRQRDIVQTLRRLAAERADRDRVMAALRVLFDRVERSPDAAYRDYQQRLEAYNCDLAARIHNATSAAQRQAARQRLLGWAEDLRSLAARRD